MKYAMIFIILFLVACVPQQPKLYGSNKTANFARKIDATNRFPIEPQWPNVLRKEPIISGDNDIVYADLIITQINCNKFNWAHKDEKLYTPIEAQQKGWGDCKDAALCKYYKLRAIGAKPEQLNLWQGWYGSRYEGHLTLAVRIGERQYILDNMDNSIIEAKDYMHKKFEPYTRFNEIGWDIN